MLGQIQGRGGTMDMEFWLSFILRFTAALCNGQLYTVFWSGLPLPSPGDAPNPGIEPWSPVLQADSLLSEPLGKPQYYLHFQDVGH